MFDEETLLKIKKYTGFTKIKSLEFFNTRDCSKFISILFKKLDSCNNYHKELNFGNILEENIYIMEFFILDIWERLRRIEFIRIESLVQKAGFLTEKEKELLGAIDNVSNPSYFVKKDGVEIYFHYLNFKKRLPSQGDENKVI